MGKEANLRRKSGKTPVMLYRAFLKLSLAGAIYAAYLVLRGAKIEETGLAVFVAIVGAVAYEITYYVYKSKDKTKATAYADPTWLQVVTLSRLVVYHVGLFSVLFGSKMVYEKAYYGIVLIAVGLVLCQQIHNNKRLFSHLSTFCENAAAGFIVITLELLFLSLGEGKGQWTWVISVAVTLMLYALTEVFFYYFNKGKHKGNATKDQLIADRIAQFLRNILVVLIIWIAWVLFIISGCVQFVIELGVYDKAIAVIPIVISVVMPALDGQMANKEKKPTMIKYDPRVSVEEFRRELIKSFGQGCYSVKALEYVCANMNAKNGMTRDNGEDYFVHPIAVASILLEHCTTVDDETVAAALLHDCIEDIADCTYEKLKDEYTENIANYVQMVSKKEGVDYHIHENMREYIQDICDSVPATMIKIADRMNNNSTMDNRTDEDKAEKTKETQSYFKVLIYSAMPHDQMNRQFYKLADEFFDQNII